MIEYLTAALILLFFTALFWDLLKKLASTATTMILNGVAGLLILLFLNTIIGWDIPLNIATVLVSALFGIPGVGTVVVLHFFNMI